MEVKIKRGGFQHQFLKSDDSLVALITGFGGGKTWIGSLKAIMLSKENAPCDGLVIAYSWEQLNNVLIRAFREHLDNMGVAYTYRRQDQILELPWANIIFRVASKDIIGINVAWAWGDEACYFPDRSFIDIFGRVRDKRAKNLQIIFTSAPHNGTNSWICKNFETNPLDGSMLIRGSTYDNSHLNEQYIKNLESSYTPRQLRAYMNGEFIDLSGDTVYSLFREDHHVDDDLVIHHKVNNNDVHVNINQFQSSSISIACDFGSVWGAWVVFKEVSFYDRRLVYCIDEIFIGRSTTYDLAEEFISRYRNKYSSVIVYGDATGGHVRSSVSGKTDYQVIKDVLSPHFDVELRVKKKNPEVVHRINMVNAALKNDSLFFSSKCQTLINDLKNVIWSKGMRRLDKSNNDLTHMSDALGYAICAVDRNFDPYFNIPKNLLY